MTRVEELELDLKSAEEDLRRYELLEELKNNDAFKELILDGFIDYNLRNANMILENDTTKDKDLRRVYKHQRIAAGVLDNFLEAIRVQGKDSDESINYIKKIIHTEKYGEE